jgi:protein-L-isoaspartate(D-aspartate) O-methyltransferase
MFEDNYKHKGMRRALVKIVEQKGVKDERVLDAINTIPRHLFIENAFLEHAYQDKAFPIGEGQTISQPYTVARQTELLEIKKGDKVLEIGTGSGYQTCVLLHLGAKVYTIEVIEKLYRRTSSFLPKLGYEANFFLGDGTLGLPAYAPYNKILVTAGAPYMPETLIKQLAIGGMLVIPVGDSTTQSMIRLTRKSEKEFTKEEFGNYSFVPLVGKMGWNQ